MTGDVTTLSILGPALIGVGALLLYAVSRTGSGWQPDGLGGWTALTAGLFLLLSGGGATVLILSGASAEGPSPRSATIIGSDAPQLRFRDLDSNEWRRLEDYRGEVVLLNLWATWCPPCLDELPELNRFRQTYGSKGVEVITISDERPETIRRFEREQFEIETVNGYLPGDLEWPAPYDRVLQSRPYSFVIGPEKTVLNMWAGARDYGFFVRAVRPHLPGSSSPSTGSSPR